MLIRPHDLSARGEWTATRTEKAALDQQATIEAFLAGIERRALRIAQLSVRDRDAALDIVQDAMISLVRRYGSRPASEWRPLFFRILTNRIHDHQRRGAVRRRWLAWTDRSAASGADDPLERVPAAAADGPEQRVRDAHAMRALEAAVGRLPARQQQAFLLRALEGLDVASTAAAMGCSAGSVKTHYSRAVHTLRAALGEHWP